MLSSKQHTFPIPVACFGLVVVEGNAMNVPVEQSQREEIKRYSVEIVANLEFMIPLTNYRYLSTLHHFLILYVFIVAVTRANHTCVNGLHAHQHEKV